MKENTARKITIIEPIKALETQKLRVAAYARVSSDSEDQLNSFATQVSYYNQLIRENDRWELIEVFADEGVTGVSMEKRTEFNRMIEECRQGNIDRILTKSVSRFARNTLDSINTLRELKSLGVSVLFEKEGIDTENLSGENLVTLYSMCAQQESMSISQNCKKGVRMKMADGTYVASNPPYGYRLVNNRLEIYEAEAAVVRRIFREYLNGSGIELIIKSLNGDGIKPKNSGKSWRYSTISGILENERYIGDKLFQKKYREDLLPYHLNRNKGELPKYYIEHCHDPIIDKMQYQLVKILRDNRRMDTHTNPNRHLLSKKIICKRCSATYKYRILAGIIYWVCRSHNQNASTCPSERITEESIYNAFIRMYNKLKANSDSILVPMLGQLEKLREQSMRGSVELSSLSENPLCSSRLSSLRPSTLFSSRSTLSESRWLDRDMDAPTLTNTPTSPTSAMITVTTVHSIKSLPCPLRTRGRFHLVGLRLRQPSGSYQRVQPGGWPQFGIILFRQFQNRHKVTPAMAAR